MAEMNLSHKTVLIDLISDFEDFISKLEKRKKSVDF